MSTDSTHHIRFWPVMIAIFLGSFVTVLSMSTINIAIPVLMNELNSSLSTMQWTITGFMLAMGTVAPLTGFLGDRFSYKRLYVFALVGFTVTSALCALAWDPASLVFFRILQGCFTGLVMPATMTIIYQVVPRERQAMAISLWSLSAMLAPAFGPTISGWLIDNWNWQFMFWFNVPFGIVSIVLAFILIPYYRLNVPKAFDFIGLLTVVVGSLSLLIAISEGHKWGWSDVKTIGLIALGIIVIGLFIWRELKVKVPLLNLRVFRNGRYTITLIIASIITISLYSGTYLTPLFLQQIQHVTPLDSGLILLPASLAMAIAMPAVGKLYGKIGPMRLMIAGIALIAVGTLALSWLSVDVSHGYIIFWMLVRNIGIALSTMPASNAGMEEIPRELSGHASSINNWIRNVLGSFAIALFTSMLASRQTVHVADLKSAAEGAGDQAAIGVQAFTMSVNDVYLLATIIVLVSLPIALLVRKKPKPEMAVASAADSGKSATA
ncbi:MDR family MFS transporter [Paenibacillus cymbidii]|uniref:MDR family MFS transporter n=1 Tax=Paenibacillus cymbidii TaxID=1639034 RepID=UPI001081C255|nr:MDR family MFS transporter [Paenibacillus cymbidii]